MKKIGIVLTLAMFAFVGMSFGQTALQGDWTLTMDKSQAAGTNAGKDVGTITFNKAADGTYYFTAKEIRNGYTAKCNSCPGALKGKSVVGDTKWGQGFKLDRASRTFKGGSVTEPASGKVGKGVTIKVINPTTMEMSFTNKKGKTRTVILKKA